MMLVLLDALPGEQSPRHHFLAGGARAIIGKIEVDTARKVVWEVHLRDLEFLFFRPHLL